MDTKREGEIITAALPYGLMAVGAIISLVFGVSEIGAAVFDIGLVIAGVRLAARSRSRPLQIILILIAIAIPGGYLNELSPFFVWLSSPFAFLR